MLVKTAHVDHEPFVSVTSIHHRTSESCSLKPLDAEGGTSAVFTSGPVFFQASTPESSAPIGLGDSHRSRMQTTLDAAKEFEPTQTLLDRIRSYLNAA